VDRFKVYEQLGFEAVPRYETVRAALLKLTDDQIAECLSAMWGKTNSRTVENYNLWARARSERLKMASLHPNGSDAGPAPYYSIQRLMTWQEPQFFCLPRNKHKGPQRLEWWNGEKRRKVFSTWIGTGAGQYVWRDPADWLDYGRHKQSRTYESSWVGGLWYMTTPPDDGKEYERDRWSGAWMPTAAERAREQAKYDQFRPLLTQNSYGHWAVLGVEVGVSKDDVKAAYRRLASKHHPDRGGDAAVMAKINVAYAALTS
jgi:hypothetical protein